MRRLARLLALVPGLAPACSAAPGPSVQRARTRAVSEPVALGDPPPRAGRCALSAPHGPRPLDGTRRGGSVALARTGGETVAYVADEDSRAIHTVSVDRKRELATTRLGGAPAQLLVLDDGRVVATLRDTGSVAVLAPRTTLAEPLGLLCERAVAAEPIGLAATPGDSRLLVASGWGRTLTALDARSLEPVFTAPLEREPRSVLVDDDGLRAFVSHLVGGRLSVVDLGAGHAVRTVDLGVEVRTAGVGAGGRERSGAQGYALAKSVDESADVGEEPRVKGTIPKPAPPGPRRGPAPAGRIFAPFVTVNPGDPTRRSHEYYGQEFVSDGAPKEAPQVAVVDLAKETSRTQRLISVQAWKRDCLIPRDARARSGSPTLLVACMGIDSLLELDARGVDPLRMELRRFALPSGPTGVAVDEVHERAVAWSQLAGKVAVVDLGSDATVDTIDVSYAPEPAIARVAAGRALFFKTADRRIANDGVACASCHPEGRDDALTWSTPDGPRQTIALAGRLRKTGPYGWVGRFAKLDEYVKNTVSRLGGAGLDDGDLRALVDYLEAMPGPGRAGAPAGDERVRRGAALFADAAVGCAGCHVEGRGTDGTTHDVKSRVEADGATRFDTPSLAFVSGSAPYFHDGRYATLAEMLGSKSHAMGRAASLDAGDREALVAYLSTL